MTVRIGHASIDENGKASGGEAGDQTKKEICIRDWYDKGWNKVLRPKSSIVAEKIAATTEAVCANDNVGYDQTQRTTLYANAKANNWNIAIIKTKCETDCSALVSVAVNAAGVVVSKDIYTGIQAKALLDTGEFEVLTDAKYLTQDKYLKRGDILLKEGSHTAVVLTNGSAVSSPTPKTPTPSKKPSGEKVHVVVKGDTLTEIANAYNTTPEKLASYNKLSKPDSLSIGQKIRIP